MRLRIFIAALLAGTIITPALAQDGQNRRAERMERRDNGGQNVLGREPGGEAMRAAPERVERAPREQVQRDVQPQAQRGDGGNGGGNGGGGGWQRRQQAPTVDAGQPAAGQQAPARAEGRWQGNASRANDGGNWNRGEARQARVPGVPPTWQRGDRDRDGDGIRNGRFRDRDGDGIRNARDRDRDGDGIRNRRDWDRNNDGNVDRRWDRNNNGVIDRRFDRNRDGIRNNGGNQNWNRQWRNDNRYDWQRYRTTNRNLFRQPRYYSPYGYGYGYQRFGIGIYLDSVFFGSQYRISDPWQYRLPYAEWPYEWVRYYDDVLLVDTRNGYIVDVIHDFFW